MKQSSPNRHSALIVTMAAAGLGLALLAAVSGCRSLGQPASASFASVTISNHTTDEIAAATARVFGADGYRGGRNVSGQMIFEKEASRGTSFAREGIVAAQGGATTINRVRVEIVPLSGGVHRLQCKAFMVTGGSDPFFQDEVPVAHIRRAPYQALLDKAAKELK
jgi:hypothetical protein